MSIVHSGVADLKRHDRSGGGIELAVHQQKHISQAQRAKNGTAVAEIPVVLFVLIFLFLLPLINLLWLAMAEASIAIITLQAADRAASQPTYTDALTSINQEAQTFLQSGIARMIRMRPVNGYQNCGLDLYTIATDFHTQASETFGPNTMTSTPPSTLDDFFEYNCAATYEIQPLVPLSFIYGMAKVPGLGAPAVLTYRVNRVLEHPEGLAAGYSAVGFSKSGAHTPSCPPSAGFNSPEPTAGNWNFPEIYSKIQAAGETVVAINVVVVPGNNGNWTPAGVTVVNGEKIWIDTHSLGVWNPWPEGGDPNVDANGYSAKSAYTNTNPNLCSVSLDGRVGASGTAFFLGDDQYNYPPAGSGDMAMIMNDAVGMYYDNTGAQLVRVVVVR